MNRVIDDLFYRFAHTGRSPPGVVLTAEGYESTQNINPQEIAHVTNHFVENGGTLHAVRLNLPAGPQIVRGGQLTDLPVSLMIGRDTGGAVYEHFTERLPSSGEAGNGHHQPMNTLRTLSAMVQCPAS